MIYKQNIHISSSQKVIEHNISSCIKCGNDDIHIDEYEDNYGYISTAKCKYCGNEIQDNTSVHGVIIKWNESNNILLVIADKEKLIESTKNEIKVLKKLLKQQLRITK